VVEPDTLFIDEISGAVGEDLGPGNGNSHALDAKLGYEADVVLVAVVEVKGHVGGVVVLHGLDGQVGESVPDIETYSPIMAIPIALVLIGRGRCTPSKVFGKFTGLA